MNTQVATWPNGIRQSDTSLQVKPAAEYSETITRPVTAESSFENGAVVLFTAFFVAELVVVVAGIGVILASLAALAL
jgi:hypothetical protein